MPCCAADAVLRGAAGPPLARGGAQYSLVTLSQHPMSCYALLQTLCYVEQLGTHWPVEAPSGGELVRFEVEEGGPVEYKQVVAYIQPEFESSNPGFGLRK